MRTDIILSQSSDPNPDSNLNYNPTASQMRKRRLNPWNVTMEIAKGYRFYRNICLSLTMTTELKIRILHIPHWKLEPNQEYMIPLKNNDHSNRSWQARLNTLITRNTKSKPPQTIFIPYAWKALVSWIWKPAICNEGIHVYRFSTRLECTDDDKNDHMANHTISHQDCTDPNR